MKAILVFLLLFVLFAPQVRAQSQKRRVSGSEVNAVVQAIEDEIYDYGYQKQFYQMGEAANEPSAGARGVRMRVYIDPEIDLAYASGRVIYKLMPYGEVLRDFTIRKDGVIVLAGNPQNGFPPTQESSTKTVYLDDDEVCRMKHDWLRHFFQIDDVPSRERIEQAVERQKLRVGFSDWEYRHHDRGK